MSEKHRAEHRRAENRRAGNQHAEHRRPENRRAENHRAASRVLGLTALAGLALSAAPAAMAATQGPDTDASPGRAGLPTMTTGDLTDGLTSVRLYPLAGGPLDLLSNNLVVPVGGTELSTFPVTAPFRDGLLLRDVPMVKSLLDSERAGPKAGPGGE